MNLYALLLRPLLFKLFTTEGAHDLAIMVARHLGSSPFFFRRVRNQFAFQAPNRHLEQSLFGLRFPTPFGLAAGMDKNGEALHFWEAIGFGFTTMGTVTGEEQKGNPKPRLFRIPKEKSLINRMGFNNWGAAKVSAHLHRNCPELPRTPIGISIGKSKNVPTDNMDAIIHDHLVSLKLLYGVADYVEVNVSSPNTPGLRTLLFTENLQPLLQAIIACLEDLWVQRPETEGTARPCRDLSVKRKRKPLLLKISPDMSDDEVKEVVSLSVALGVDGLIASNTSTDPSLLPGFEKEQGGRSGPVLLERTLKRVALVRRHAPKMPIIASGGIFTVTDALRVIKEGASLIQIYTALPYEGPSLPGELASGLHKAMHDHYAESITNLKRR